MYSTYDYKEPSGDQLVGSFPSRLNINIDASRYDQNRYIGRVQHFCRICNPFNLVVSQNQLEHARKVIHNYRVGGDMGNTTVNDLWRAKQLCDSAFHPDTGEQIIFCARMSTQAPMNMLMAGLMLTYYKTVQHVILLQWLNQSYNAAINYSNRGGNTPISNSNLGLSYVLATGTAIATTLGIQAAFKGHLAGRLAPMVAMAAANCINIPIMRLTELQLGTPVVDYNNVNLGQSQVAASSGVSMVTISRIMMAVPAFVLTPIVIHHLDRNGVFKHYPRASLPIQLAVVGTCFALSTPLCCALFPQRHTIPVSSLEPHLQDSINRLPIPPNKVYFNKGL